MGRLPETWPDTLSSAGSSPRTILGAFTDPSIEVSDPISDRFYKEVWMTAAGRNATIYEKNLLPSVGTKEATVPTETVTVNTKSPYEAKRRPLLDELWRNCRMK
ncbi:hypothetical protein AOLI_G00299470 [Acnodon oligacanthus]